jgi:hypothetical protein
MTNLLQLADMDWFAYIKRATSSSASSGYTATPASRRSTSSTKVNTYVNSFVRSQPVNRSQETLDVVVLMPESTQAVFPANQMPSQLKQHQCQQSAIESPAAKTLKLLNENVNVLQLKTQERKRTIAPTLTTSSNFI